MTGEEIKRQKVEQRKKWLEKRLALSLDQVLEKSMDVCRNILQSYAFRFADTILMYSAVRNEVDLKEVFYTGLKDGKSVYFPKTYGKGKMQFFKISDMEELVPGKYGVLEPSGESEAFDKEKSTHVLCLVPAIAFDKRGYRIGYGAGYYDRFIKKGNIIFAGVTYEEALCDNVPFDKRHDKNVDMIFTEKGVYVVGKEKK